MAISFRIPKQSDRDLVAAVGTICQSFPEETDIKLYAQVAWNNFELPLTNPEQSEKIAFAIKEKSQVIDNIYVNIEPGHTLFNVVRNHDQSSDTVNFTDQWQRYFPNTELYSSTVAKAKNELKASTLVSAMTGLEDSEWGRYRKAQMEVMNSLQVASENLLIKSAEQNAKLDEARAERYSELEKNLREQIDRERDSLTAEFEQKLTEVSIREESIKAREDSFNTKEARYVARQMHEAQITQVKEWLKDWCLTPGTSKKRNLVIAAYLFGMVATGFLTYHFSSESFSVLKQLTDLSSVKWWQWLLMSLKSTIPLGAFITFLVYFIRWEGAWAKQHSDEEFRNRALLIDLGRSSWLLEAVRDGQEAKTPIPPELLKELSRNLYSTSSQDNGDVHPQAISELLLHGLSSLRIKSPDGSEVEASRGKEKK